MKRGGVSSLRVLVVVLALASSAFPQADVSTATIKGTVYDPSGAVVAGAVVTVRSLDKGITRTDRSNSSGLYQVALLQPGVYEVRVEATGFDTAVASRVEVTVGQLVVYDFRMRVGAVATEMMVTAEAPLIEVERTQQANTINRLQVENLPNIGRDFTSYVFTLPGVNSSNAPRAQNPGFTFGTSGFSIGGSNGRNNLVTIDGGENEYGSGQIRTNISVEAIQEFQVNRNAFAAEFGFTAGTAVNVVSKGGTNDFHGSGYVFYRNQHTSARNFFNTSPEKAFDQRLFPGGTLGGPIKRNRAFFFTSYEGLKLDTVRFRSYTDNPAVLGPTAAQGAHLAAMAASPSANIRRIGEGLRAALTTTNFPLTMQMLSANEGNINAPDRLHSWTTRIDYQVTDRDSLTGRFSLTHNDTDNLLEGNAGSPSASTDLLYRDYTTVVTWIHNFDNSVINQVRVQLSPNNSARTVPKAPGTTSLIIPGIGLFGRDFATPFNTFQNRYQFEDIVSWNKGPHTMKFGGSYRPVDYRVINELWFSGEWQFASGVFPLILAVPPADRQAFAIFNISQGQPVNGPPLANFSALQSFNLGFPFLFRQGFGNPEWRDWAHYLGLFAQDSWKVTPRLTLDFGVRMDYDVEPTPLQKNAYVSPRLGFAWDPWGDGSTVIRGGGGLFYSPVYYQVAYVTNLLNDSGQFINQIFKTPLDGAQSPAALWAAGVALGKLPFTALTEADLNAFGVATGPKNPGRVVFDADPDYKNNYSIQGSLGISRKLFYDMSFDIAYQVYRGVHIQVPHETNYVESTAPCVPGNTIPACLDPARFGPAFARIDPSIVQLNIYKSIGNSIYHGMTTSLRKRYSNNFQFEAHYTWSKAIDDNTDFNSAFAAFIPTRLDLERAVSAFDVPHNFTANAVFKTPFRPGSDSNLFERAFADITISPIVFVRSGIPFTVRIGRDTNNDTHGLYDRPFLASRNSGRGDSFASTNLRITKQFYIDRDSGFRVEFTTEAANIFNHPNFTSVNDVFGTDNARFIDGPFDFKGSKNIPRTSPLGFTSAAPGRQIQFGLKIAF